jgi:hypothetical protein
MFKENKTYTLKSGAQATIERVTMEMRGGKAVPGRVRYVIEGMPRISVTAETWTASVKPEDRSLVPARAGARRYADNADRRSCGSGVCSGLGCAGAERGDRDQRGQATG